MKTTILHFDELASTNTEALNQARQGADEGLCVVAKKQTAGRGRHGRVWISARDAGLYFSIVLRPKIETKFTPLITLMTAIVVFDALVELYELTPDIKWANDVHINGKKISGILAEMIETNRGTAVIVGIGINLKSSGFPAELKDSATSIEHETNRIPDAEILLQTLTRIFDEFYDYLKSDGGAEKIRREWKKRSSYASGKSIKVTMENRTIIGVTDGLEENGALRVKTESGALEVIQAGEVEMLRRV